EQKLEGGPMGFGVSRGWYALLVAGALLAAGCGAADKRGRPTGLAGAGDGIAGTVLLLDIRKPGIGELKETFSMLEGGQGWSDLKTTGKLLMDPRQSLWTPFKDLADLLVEPVSLQPLKSTWDLLR
ncbi:MAG: hypothetical protein ACE5GW_01530, partial [Planctomycetota bacterium]